MAALSFAASCAGCSTAQRPRPAAEDDAGPGGDATVCVDPHADVAPGCPCKASEPTACYFGPPDTLGVGVCHPGIMQCEGGTWSACVGEVAPTEETALGRNGEDDDCDGFEDDGLCGDGEDCGGNCCVDKEVCLGTYCLPPGDCTKAGDCDHDTRCDPAVGCVPFGPAETDETCVAGEIVPELGGFDPVLQCEWAGGIVWVPPIVVDLDPSIDGAMQPELLFVAANGLADQGGALIAANGTDCEERWRNDEFLYDDLSPLAAGDVDGDGRVEIVVGLELGGIAILDRRGEIVCREDYLFDDYEIATIAIANLDGVGDAEILYGRRVLGSDCQELWSFDEILRPWGHVLVVADVDVDGDPEIVTGDRIWDGDTGRREEHFPDLDDGNVAIADFDRATPEPEIAVVAPAGVRIQSIDGEVLFGPIARIEPGGPPTVADFDGDGEVEFGAAGSSEYVVFDPDCAGWRRGGRCDGGADGVLWSKPTRDFSSGATGSSVFDFDADGVSEVVYADECFLRIYAGPTGDTRFIVPNANGTGYEYPTIADVDGDGHTEIAVSSWGTFNGCTTDGETGTEYVDQNPGVRVWRDADESWAPSRRVWNQQAYSVTNVGEDGSIPASPENNWEIAGLNNFRVNSTDDPTVMARGVDLTARGAPSEAACPERVTLVARIANRGTRNAPRGLPVGFYMDGPPEAGGKLVCETRTTQTLPPGAAEEVRCDWLSPPATEVEVWVRADHLRVLTECEEDNNEARVPNAGCDGPG